VAETLTVLYEDDEVAAVDKPPGLVAHPTGSKSTLPTLSELLVKRWPQVGSVGPTERHGLVHRLDKDTSGVVLVAKTPKAFESLTKQFADRRIEKKYVALVQGVPSVPRGRIDAPVGRHYAKGEQMTVHPDGRTAETKYEVVESVGEYALLDVWPSTGRTHQIRVHLAALGHPVAGDTTYGAKQRPRGLDRQFLHAAEIKFLHPVTGKRITVKDPLPADLEKFLKEQR
jgi:23S rRNA pseudouridine1911/1915/1917 synthase